MKKIIFLLLITSFLITPTLSNAYYDKIVPENITREEVDEMYPEGIESIAKEEIKDLRLKLNLMELELNILNVRFLMLYINNDDYLKITDDIKDFARRVSNSYVDYQFAKISYLVSLMDAIED